MCLSLQSKPAKFESSTFLDLSPQLKAITIQFVFKGFCFYKAHGRRKQRGDEWFLAKPDPDLEVTRHAFKNT